MKQVFSFIWLVMKHIQKVWEVSSKSQLVSSQVSIARKMCLALTSVELSHLQLIRKGFKKSTVRICALRQILSWFSPILFGVLGLLWKSVYLCIDLSFKTALKLYWVLYIFSSIVMGFRGLAKCLVFKLLSTNLFIYFFIFCLPSALLEVLFIVQKIFFEV